MCIHCYFPSIQSQTIPMQAFSTKGLRSESIAIPAWAKSSFAVGLLKCIVEWVWRPWRAWAQKEVHMPIQHQLRSFWWFLEGRVGGMGRPGFNQCHWFELSFEEGLLLSWLGKQHLLTTPLDGLWRYLDSYGPQVAIFYELSPDVARERLRRLHDRATLLAMAERMNTKTGIFDDVS